MRLLHAARDATVLYVPGNPTCRRAEGGSRSAAGRVRALHLAVARGGGGLEVHPRLPLPKLAGNHRPRLTGQLVQWSVPMLPWVSDDPSRLTGLPPPLCFRGGLRFDGSWCQLGPSREDRSAPARAYPLCSWMAYRGSTPAPPVQCSARRSALHAASHLAGITLPATLRVSNLRATRQYASHPPPCEPPCEPPATRRATSHAASHPPLGNPPATLRATRHAGEPPATLPAIRQPASHPLGATRRTGSHPPRCQPPTTLRGAAR